MEPATDNTSSEIMNEQTYANNEAERIVENNHSNGYEQSFSEEALSVINKTEENNSTGLEHTSNGLENFGVEGETAPDLFSSDNESDETDGLLSTEKNENSSEDDDLEIPAFLRRQKN